MNSSPSQQALRVFLVEDTIPIRQRMAARFGAIDGVEIVGEAEEAGTALAGIDGTGADVVVVDFRLTGGTGMELLHSLGRSTSPVITIVLTNHSGAWFRQACLAAGAQYFFDKTSEFDLACNTIKRIVHERCARGLNYTGAHHV
ncbi:response regulator transcription factor [Paraburkholderia sp. RP-4-7]|jgi:two-component system response regulator DevR|uniref:Response regulator transcription factor n=1 Tax=Paraburkholderia polaris TaxID=2728848 RepID=A0A848IK13_9BURK|nr:response regulator [Paraburkholderia polaris]NMM00175.1 response regulator transcription factor [Paraburkholderia polaris]